MEAIRTIPLEGDWVKEVRQDMPLCVLVCVPSYMALNLDSCSHRQRAKGKNKGQLYPAYTNLKTGQTLYSRVQLSKHGVTDPEPDLRSKGKGRGGLGRGQGRGKKRARDSPSCPAPEETSSSSDSILDSDEEMNNGLPSPGSARQWLLCTILCSFVPWFITILYG